SQALDAGVLSDVAALHRIAEIVQHLGDAAHADAADAAEMEGADGKGQGSHAAVSCCLQPQAVRPAALSASASAASASRSAASGRPALRAAVAASSSMCGEDRKLCSRADSASAVKP